MTSIMTLPLLAEIDQQFGVTIPEDEFWDANELTALEPARLANVRFALPN